MARPGLELCFGSVYARSLTRSDHLDVTLTGGKNGLASFQIENIIYLGQSCATQPRDKPPPATPRPTITNWSVSTLHEILLGATRSGPEGGSVKGNFIEGGSSKASAWASDLGRRHNGIVGRRPYGVDSTAGQRETCNNICIWTKQINMQKCCIWTMQINMQNMQTDVCYMWFHMQNMLNDMQNNMHHMDT